MSNLLKIEGTLVSTGPETHHTGPATGTTYDYLRFESGTGSEVYLDWVIVPAYLDSFLKLGEKTTLLISVAQMPKLFGSRALHLVYGIEIEGKKRFAIEQVQRILGSMRGAALQTFLFGLVLLPAFGIGVLFWIQAIRMLNLSLPIQALQQQNGTTHMSG